MTAETPVTLSGGTSIEWAHFTFNPWWGCVKVSPACDECYADRFAKWIAPGLWERDGPRRFFENDHWRKPEAWNRRAERNGTRYRVFCASMADVFEDHERAGLGFQRMRLWDLIEATPHLDWLLLTKRPENIKRMVPESWLGRCPHDVPDCSYCEPWPSNAWIGTTVENQRYADLRLPKLVEVPAPVRFVSYEPALGPLDFSALPASSPWHSIDWIIAGGESGPKARPSYPGWFDRVRDHCVATGTSFLFKQWGEWAPAGSWQGPDHHVLPDGRWFRPHAPVDNEFGIAAIHRWGKKLAGRELGGRTWDEFPAVAR